MWFIVAFLIGMAQDSQLITQNITIETQQDAFGQQVQVATGELVNEGTQAYSSINLYTEIYDENDDMIGEGFGYPVNACGTALIDLALQPSESQRFSVSLELYEEDAVIDRVEIIPEAQAVEREVNFSPDNSIGIEQLSDQEVVAVEWLKDGGLRYGVGCDQDVFTLLDWYEVHDGDITALEAHPNAVYITDAMLRQVGLTDPAYFQRSFLSFHPAHQRMLYQTDLNEFMTSEKDGSYKRWVYGDLYRHSLQGIIWLPEGRYLAYYYGAFGEPVRYFTSDMDGRRISETIYNVTLSQTVPGPTPDGTEAVITMTLDDQTGYYLQSTVNENTELLFEAEPPGNNYPAPLYVPLEDVGARIYIVRPVEDANWLQCFDTATDELHDLTVLPLELTNDSRAWTWLSPDGQTLALAANGANGGLWLVDLTEFEEC